MEKEITEVERFYLDVAEALGVKSNYEYNPHTLGGTYRTRWNNRKPGNGRFEGYGLVRYFSADHIHVVLHKPMVVNRVFGSAAEVIEMLKNI